MTDGDLRAAIAHRDAIAELEVWRRTHKARSVEIQIDDGYGATCWTVELRGESKRRVHASEAGFLRISAAGSNPDVICLMQPDEPDEVGGSWEDWPGLKAVILAAIDRWNAVPNVLGSNVRQQSEVMT